MNPLQKLFFAFVLITLANDAWGCTCRLEAAVYENAVKNEPLIFFGTIVEKTRINDSSGGFVSATYKFVRIKAWRGIEADTFTLKTGSGSCHILLNKGNSYVIYTNPSGELSICGRTIDTDIKAELKRLDVYFGEKRFMKQPSTK